MKNSLEFNCSYCSTVVAHLGSLQTHDCCRDCWVVYDVNVGVIVGIILGQTTIATLSAVGPSADQASLAEMFASIDRTNNLAS